MRMSGLEDPNMASTPNLNASMRRRSLFNQSKIDPTISPVALVERNTHDDEEERRMLRAQAARRSILSDQSMTERGDKRYSDSYIMNEFTVCAQLFNENKITVKNAWNLRIIEILKPLCHRPTGKDLLQIAGTSLEICTKVFAIKVDDLHARGMRLANAMSRVAANHEAENGSDIEEDGGGENGEGDQQAKKKTKRRRAVNLSGPKRTVSKDAEKFVAPLPKLDPADISNRVKADFGNIESLCTLTFAMNSKNTTFVILDEEERFNSTADIVDMDKPEEEDDVIDFEQVPITSIPKTCKIMLPFKDFQFNKENPANRMQPRTKPDDPSEIPPVQLDDTINDPFLNDGDIFDNMDNDAGNTIHEEIAIAEAGHVSGHLVDKERTTIFGPQEKEQAQLNSRVNRTGTTTLTSTGQSKLGEAYNFDHIDISTGMIIDKVWAGPAHWKLKNVVHTAKEVFTGRKDDNKEKRARRKRKEPCVVNLDITDDVQINFSKKVPTKPRKTLPEYKLFLPKFDDRLINYLQDMQRMDEVLLKPGTYASDLKRMWEMHLDTLEDPHADDGFDNSQFVAADDNAPDFGSGGDNGDAMDCDVNVGLEGTEQVAAEHENLRDNLVEAPQMVETEYVPYATKAKQMNMKKLKQAIWQYLTQSSEIVATQPGERRTGRVKETTFAALYSSLPEILTGKEKLNLSCPLAFVALLHLANEENLHFKPLNRENNFTIKRNEGG
ncbi:unnamed protein product [Callosobruchus maculatus]|uniref:Condensin complex subunit 2 n=1 Tax=Callosobruchus maculatus TaxID=64391 RepID=A0A653DRB3_CALMS|nr:unnamed protein product [Callosobruchus maculatus]